MSQYGKTKNKSLLDFYT